MMPNQRNGGEKTPEQRQQRQAAERDEHTDREPLDDAKTNEPNHLGEAEQAFEQTNGGREPPTP
jgi:hypothetical protein